MSILSSQTNSLDHERFVLLLAESSHLLLIQDLDGVCMGLVKDPLDRTIDPDYVLATQAFGDSFAVLTNGEHIGSRGVNGIVERAFAPSAPPTYLPGLAAGGVQYQGRDGTVRYIGVDKDRELTLLADALKKLTDALEKFISSSSLTPEAASSLRASTILDNPASPTVNLNTAYEVLSLENYRDLQLQMQQTVESCRMEAEARGLSDSITLHLAPVRSLDKLDEKPILGDQEGPGTTDFQLMIQGAIKEFGVIVLVNEYCKTLFDKAPFGAISVRDNSLREMISAAPDANSGLRDIACWAVETLEASLSCEELNLFPILMGVGDTVTSAVHKRGVNEHISRGGSDRNFLTLTRLIGEELRKRVAHYAGGIVILVDSSGGQVRGRVPMHVERYRAEEKVRNGPHMQHGDTFIANVVFPATRRGYRDLAWVPSTGDDGNEFYRAAFKAAAQRRMKAHTRR